MFLRRSETEVYQHLIRNIKQVDDSEYDKTRKDIGDSVRDYDSVKVFLAK